MREGRLSILISTQKKVLSTKQWTEERGPCLLDSTYYCDVWHLLALIVMETCIYPGGIQKVCNSICRMAGRKF